MFARYLSSAGAGMMVTTALLWVMHYLVEVAEPVETAPRDPDFLGLVEVREDSPVKTIEPVTVIIPAPVEVPKHRPPPETSTTITPVKVRHLPPPPTEPQPGGTGQLLGDGPLINIINVQPEYPLTAASRGLEGYVIVRFDVTAQGTVENVAIVESSHGVFEKPAIKAATRSRYKPRVIDGVASGAANLQKLYRFELEQH